MSQQWYVRTSKADRGPYSTEKLRRLADEGRVKPATLVSRDGEKWIKASQIRGLEFGNVKRANKRRAANAESEQEPPTHVPWYEGQSAARKAQAYSQLDTAGLRESMPSNAGYFVDRVKFSGGIAVIAALLTYAAVRVCYFFGVIEVTTVNSTLAWRVGLPAAVFVFLYWWTRPGSRSGPITSDMSDDEIAEML